MFEETKKCIANHDIKGLRYIFLDCLDVDPTFDKYKEDYDCCKNIEGFFDAHQNLRGLQPDENVWTFDYWIQLKVDLEKNFSEERFEHMIRVAKVVYADKIIRLLEERKGQAQENIFNNGNLKRELVEETYDLPSEEELEDQRIENIRKELEAEKQRIEAEQRAQQERIALKQKNAEKQLDESEDRNVKKVPGIVWIIVAIIIVLLIVIVFQ